MCCGKHLHDHIISPREVVWAHKTSLTPPFSFIEMSVPSRESVRSCTCVLGVQMYPFCFIRYLTIELLTVWYFYFVLLEIKRHRYMIYICVYLLTLKCRKRCQLQYPVWIQLPFLPLVPQTYCRIRD